MKRTVIRKTFPRIRSIRDNKTGATFYQVDARKQGTAGKRETFATKKDAESRAAAIAEEFSANGAEGLAIPIALRAMAQRCAAELEEFGKTIADATSYYADALRREKAKAASHTIPFLADAWLKDKAQNRDKPLRPDSIDDVKEIASLLKRLYPDKRLLEVTQQDIENYLGSLKAGARRRFNIKNRIKAFFNWCIKKKFTTYNPCKDIEITVPEHPPKILHVAKCIALMKACETPQHNGLMCYTAICIFAGLRPAEAASLKWENVHLEERTITVDGSTSKVKETRNVAIEDNLYEWLQSYPAKRVGFIAPRKGMRTKMENLRADLGFSVAGKNKGAEAWVEDILRHCYGSYWLARDKDRAHLAENMGTSLKMIKQHYKQVVSKVDCIAFWNILPANVQAAKEDEVAAIDRLFYEHSAEGRC